MDISVQTILRAGAGPGRTLDLFAGTTHDWGGHYTLTAFIREGASSVNNIDRATEKQHHEGSARISTLMQANGKDVPRSSMLLKINRGW